MHGLTNLYRFKRAWLAVAALGVVALFGVVSSERAQPRVAPEARIAPEGRIAPAVAVPAPVLSEAPHPTRVPEGGSAIHAAPSGALDDRVDHRLQESNLANRRARRFGVGTADPGTDVRAEIECLASTIYFESRGEPDIGKLAVGHVVINRVSDIRFPSQICKVVRQGGAWPRHRCQFSWWCDGRSDKPRDLTSWETSVAVARRLFWGLSEDPTQGALWYHAEYVKPSWAAALKPGRKIGRHVFYGEGRLTLPQAQARN